MIKRANILLYIYKCVEKVMKKLTDIFINALNYNTNLNFMALLNFTFTNENF